MISRVWQWIGFCAGPVVIVCTAVILAGTPDGGGDQGQVDPNNTAQQRTDNAPVHGKPATQHVAAIQ
jgi:hypothetical protein